MAVKLVKTVDVVDTYASGQSFSHELSPVTFTITRIDWEFEFDITTATSVLTQDALYRILTSLNLSSPLGSHLSMTDLRPLHHLNKLIWGDKFSAPGIAGTGANQKKKVVVRLDFGVNPQDPWDLTAGIPAHVGNLSMSGGWATPAALGTAVTINSCVLRTKLYGWQPEFDGEAQPRAFPVFMLSVDSPTATTGSLGRPFSVPNGHFLQNVGVMVTNGVAPADNRSDLALQDIGIAVPIAGNATRYKDTWFSFKQEYKSTAVADDDGVTFATPTIATEGDIGVGMFPMSRLASSGNPLYGVDLRPPAVTGDMQIQAGVLVAANTKLSYFLQFYDTNPALAAA